MKKILTIILSSAMLMSAAATTQAGGMKKAVSGTLACGGNQLIRNGGTEFHQTNYVFRNFNSFESIDINRIRVYDANGSLLSDYSGAALPDFTNSVLGPLDNSLQPYQTAQLGTRSFFGDLGLSKSQRPLQVLIDWSAYVPVTPLKVSLVRVVRERIVTTDSLGNQVVKQGVERSRHRSGCKAIELNRG